MVFQDDDEADTVGCCTLKVENVEPVPPNLLKVMRLCIYPPPPTVGSILSTHRTVFSLIFAEEMRIDGSYIHFMKLYPC